MDRAVVVTVVNAISKLIYKRDFETKSSFIARRKWATREDDLEIAVFRIQVRNLSQQRYYREAGDFVFPFNEKTVQKILNQLAPQYREKLIFVSDVDFKENCTYGEVIEFYLKFLSKINGITGISINSWSSRDADRAFLSVEETFLGSKFHGIRRFEIDWIFLSGSTITVIEVEEMIEKDSRVLQRNFNQILKSQIILESLLGATGCLDITVNYLVAFPNIPISLIRQNSFAPEHQQDFNQITDKGDRVGFVTKNCVDNGKLYIYNKTIGNLEEKGFMEIVNNGAKSHQQKPWSDNYSKLAALVVTSKLMGRGEVTDLHEIEHCNECEENNHAFEVEEENNGFLDENSDSHGRIPYHSFINEQVQKELGTEASLSAVTGAKTQSNKEKNESEFQLGEPCHKNEEINEKAGDIIEEGLPEKSLGKVGRIDANDREASSEHPSEYQESTEKTTQKTTEETTEKGIVDEISFPASLGLDLLGSCALEIAKQLRDMADGMAELMFLNSETDGTQSSLFTKNVDFLLVLQILLLHCPSHDVDHFARTIKFAIKNKHFEGIIRTQLIHFWVRIHCIIEDEKPEFSEILYIMHRTMDESILKKNFLSQLKKYSPSSLLVSTLALMFEKFFIDCFSNYSWCRKVYCKTDEWQNSFRILFILVLIFSTEFNTGW